MDHTIPTEALLQHVLLPHFGAIEARVEARATDHTGNKCVQRSASTTSCNQNHHHTSFLINHDYHVHDHDRDQFL
jgi:hypothetical protein